MPVINAMIFAKQTKNECLKKDSSIMKKHTVHIINPRKYSLHIPSTRLKDLRQISRSNKKYSNPNDSKIQKTQKDFKRQEVRQNSSKRGELENKWKMKKILKEQMKLQL